MSKKRKFLRQDYFRYKRLGKKWRRPKGLQSKQRIKKAGSGFRPRIGYGSFGRKKIVLIKNVNELSDVKKTDEIIYLISSSVGTRKKIEISKKAKELNFPLKGIGRVLKEDKRMQKKKEDKKKEKKQTPAQMPKEAKKEMPKEEKKQEVKKGE